MVELLVGTIILIFGIVGYAVAKAVGRNKRLKNDVNIVEYP